MNRDHEVVENSRSRVQTITKLTNFIKKSGIKEYSGEYGSNPWSIKVTLRDVLKFDQIR